MHKDGKGRIPLKQLSLASRRWEAPAVAWHSGRAALCGVEERPAAGSFCCLSRFLSCFLLISAGWWQEGRGSEGSAQQLAVSAAQADSLVVSLIVSLVLLPQGRPLSPLVS